MVVIAFAYTCCCAAFVHNIITIYDRNSAQLKDEHNDTSDQILQNMSTDRAICYHCINKPTRFVRGRIRSLPMGSAGRIDSLGNMPVMSCFKNFPMNTIFGFNSKIGYKIFDW